MLRRTGGVVFTHRTRISKWQTWFLCKHALRSSVTRILPEILTWSAWWPVWKTELWHFNVLWYFLLYRATGLFIFIYFYLTYISLLHASLLKVMFPFKHYIPTEIREHPRHFDEEHLITTGIDQAYVRFPCRTQLHSNLIKVWHLLSEKITLPRKGVRRLRLLQMHKLFKDNSNGRVKK